MTYDYEAKIRHSICIFLSLETLFLCGIILAFSSDEFIFLKYHEISILNVIEFPMIACVFPLFFTIMSIKSKTWYLFYEGLHVLLSFLIFLLTLSDIDTMIFGLMIFFILCGRIIIYSLINHFFNKNMLKKVVKDIHDEELKHIIDKLDNLKSENKSDK